MKGRKLTFEEVKKLKDETKIIVYWGSYKFIGSIDVIDNKKYLRDENKGIIFTDLDNSVGNDKFIFYQYIENDNNLNESKKFNQCMENLENFILKSINNTYYGDEILKMIREGELKEGTKLLGRYGKFDEFDNKFIVEKFSDELVLLEILSSDYRKEINYSQLLHMTFTIKEREYLTFEEAINTKKLFKYKSWNNYYTLINVIKYLKNFDYENIEKMLDEKAWEVEE